MGRSSPQRGCTEIDKAPSLDGLRQDLGLTFRQVSRLTGIPPRSAHRAITDPSRAHTGHARQIRSALRDERRRRRSSDPELLGHVMDRAVPFLQERLNPNA